MKASQKGQLRLLKKLTTVFALILLSGQVTAEVELKGKFIQGGMIVGHSDKIMTVVLLGTVKVPVHPSENVFVFGFGRDAKAEDTLSVEFADGTSWQKALNIKQREYKVDKIEGVAQKYVSPPESVLSRIRNDSKMVKQARSEMSHRADFLEQAIRPAKGRISGVYGSQRVFNGVPKRPHFGMDIAGPTGTKVIAPLSGKVVLAEPDLYYSGGTLIIDHGMGITTTYIHLSHLDVKVGDTVKQGDKIAEIGATGRVTGPHLDWRINWFDRRMDPQLLLPNN